MTDRATAARWLAPRLRDAPPELAAEVRRLLAEVEPGRDAAPAGERSPVAASVPDRLAAAALRGFDEVLAAAAADRGGRDAALGLLAADAVLTCAFEAAANLGEGTGDLAERLGPRGVLGRRLAGAVQSVDRDASGAEGQP